MNNITFLTHGKCIIQPYIKRFLAIITHIYINKIMNSLYIRSSVTGVLWNLKTPEGILKFKRQVAGNMIGTSWTITVGYTSVGIGFHMHYGIFAVRSVTIYMYAKVST